MNPGLKGRPKAGIWANLKAWKSKSWDHFVTQVRQISILTGKALSNGELGPIGGGPIAGTILCIFRDFRLNKQADVRRANGNGNGNSNVESRDKN